MTDQVRTEHGAMPWKPSADAEVVEEFDRYEVPLEGLLIQGGYTYLFRCLAGRDEPASLWVYARVEQRDIDQLSAAEDEQYEAAVLEILLSRPFTAALASDPEGLSVSVEVEPHGEDSYSRVFRSAVDAIDRELEFLDRAHRERHDLELVSAP